MRCPKCRAESQVVESRTRSSWQYRRRRCPSCEHMFSTKEMVVDKVSKMMKDLIASTEEALNKYGH